MEDGKEVFSKQIVGKWRYIGYFYSGWNMFDEDDCEYMEYIQFKSDNTFEWHCYCQSLDASLHRKWEIKEEDGDNYFEDNNNMRYRIKVKGESETEYDDENDIKIAIIHKDTIELDLRFYNNYPKELKEFKFVRVK